MTAEITSAAGDEHDAKFNCGSIFAINLTAELGELMFGYTTSGHCFFREAG